MTTTKGKTMKKNKGKSWEIQATRTEVATTIFYVPADTEEEAERIAQEYLDGPNNIDWEYTGETSDEVRHVMEVTGEPAKAE